MNLLKYKFLISFQFIELGEEEEKCSQDSPFLFQNGLCDGVCCGMDDTLILVDINALGLGRKTVISLKIFIKIDPLTVFKLDSSSQASSIIRASL